MKRLHLGASSLEKLVGTPTETTINMTWIHLGDAPNFSARAETGSIFSSAKTIAKKWLLTNFLAPKEGQSALYAKTDFRPWVFSKRDRLPFEDDIFTFVYCEHMLEHFRFDIACDLLNECFRVLRPQGIMRIVVPDADYRSYEQPEIVGFPNRCLPFNHPNKHKTRWNVYLMAKTLEFVGFKAVPLVWCDDEGELHKQDPRAFYSEAKVDEEFAASLAYVQRPFSLIVDGFKQVPS